MKSTGTGSTRCCLLRGGPDPVIIGASRRNSLASTATLKFAFTRIGGLGLVVRQTRITPCAIWRRMHVELMNQMGWKKAHIVGVSMGGMPPPAPPAVLPSHETHPLAHLLIHPNRTRPRPSQEPHALLSLLASLAQPARPPLNSGYTSNLEYMLKFHGGRIDSRPPQSFSSAIRQLCGIVSFHISKDRLMELKNHFMRSRIPAMVVHGTEDALVHLKAAGNLAKMLGARLVVFEGRGHALNHEDTELFNRLLLRHFYSAILGGGNHSMEAAARRAGWWLPNMDMMEQRVIATVDKMKSQMVGLTEWMFSFLFRKSETKTTLDIEWLPPTLNVPPVVVAGDPTLIITPEQVDVKKDL
ncbi:Alpha/Beta hydrolase protein [Obelidium mucronatum]|nr:Alpha/Beta hydrolase protein [Obelidium mucronatum]